MNGIRKLRPGANLLTRIFLSYSIFILYIKVVTNLIIYIMKFYKIYIGKIYRVYRGIFGFVLCKIPQKRENSVNIPRFKKL